MFLVLLWIGLFLDVLNSFSLEPPTKIAKLKYQRRRQQQQQQQHGVPDHTPSCSSSRRASHLYLYAANEEVLPSMPSSEFDSDRLADPVVITLPPILSDDDDAYPSVLHKIYIQTILSPKEAQKCCDIAQGYATETGRWETPDGDRHLSYPTCDFPVEECSALETYLHTIDFDRRLFSALSDQYGIDGDTANMEYIDLFVAHYQAKNETMNNQGMDRLEFHRDGSLLSFSLLLNSPDDFTGGGTMYDALRDVDDDFGGVLHPGGVIRPTQAGQACLHCGKILHGADVVTSGFRTVLVGFVDVAERNIRPGILAKACTDWGRMDVAAFRNRRQAKMNNSGWTLTNERYLPKDEHPTFIKGFAPAFSSIQRRAEPEYQRQKKLETEDFLLRSILLPPEERAEAISWGDEDSITIL